MIYTPVVMSDTTDYYILYLQGEYNLAFYSFCDKHKYTYDEIICLLNFNCMQITFTDDETNKDFIALYTAYQNFVQYQIDK